MTDVEMLRGEYMKVGDTLPDLRAQLFEAGSSFNLTGYTVDMRLRKAESDTPVVDQQITVEQEDRGIVTYSWGSGDTDEPGTYVCEFVADNGSGSTITFPNRGYARVYVEETV